MANSDRHCLIVATLGLVLLAGSASVVEAASFGAGPGILDLSFYPNDTAIIEVGYGATSVDPTIRGYAVAFEGIPEGMFVSLETDTEVRTREFLDPSCPRDSGKRWMFPIYFGRLGPGVDLTPPPDGRRGVGLGGIWTPGTQITVGVFCGVNMSYITPEIPRGSWTFTNSSPYDIVDGVLSLEKSMRYIPGLVIPAGGSLIVEGQMASAATWAFGGLLDSPEPQPVFAFDPSGASPEGIDFSEVFTADTDYPTTGRDAALRANGVIWHMGPRPGYVSSLEPYATAPTQFDLYSFSTGQLVGGGQQAPILSPMAWDPGQTPVSPGGGPGTWDTATAQWSDGAADQVWNNSADDDVVFGGSPGEVVIDEPISARSLTFNTSGYILSGTAALTLSSDEVYVPAGEATIAVPVAGSAGLVKTGAGVLSLTADNICTGPIRITGGTLAVGADINLGDTSTPGDVIIDKGATLRTTSSFSTRRRVIIGQHDGTVDVAAGTLTLLGPEGDWGLVGTIGKLTKIGPGELKLKTATDVGRTGDIEIVAGTLSNFGGYLGSSYLTIHPDGTFNGGEGANWFTHVTINGGLLTFVRSGSDGGTGNGKVQFYGLSMTGGTINIDTIEQAGEVVCRGDVTVHPSDQTAVIKSESGAGMNVLDGFHTLDVADGDAPIDMDIQVAFSLYRFSKDGEGLLRISGDQANFSSGEYTDVRAGILELAKPDGVMAARNLRLIGGEVRLSNPNQIHHFGKMDLAGGTFKTNGFSESLRDLALTDDSILDMGDGAGCVLAFVDSHLTAWDPDATLRILNWSGERSGGGTERLLFGDSELGLLADQLEQIRFVDPLGFAPGIYGAAILADGEVVATPEPATLGMLALGGLAIFRRRRR